MEKSSPFDMYQRIAVHKKHQKERDKKMITLFKLQIQKGKYPQKCLICFTLGLNYCQFWNKTFECEPTKFFTDLQKAFEAF